ncbi:hypothetical protein ACFXOI_32300 [Streptomyces bacillaris]|uniref:hypothetical protein n=1 Tax=Streptomyces bacillaris TaxID=68179 RepID=UPI003676D3DC
MSTTDFNSPERGLVVEMFLAQAGHRVRCQHRVSRGHRALVDGETERFCKVGGLVLTQPSKLYGSSVASTSIPESVRERTEFQPAPPPLPWAEKGIRRLFLHVPHVQHPHADGSTDATPEMNVINDDGEKLLQPPSS